MVRINDRGPFVDTRVIDLSKRSAEVLGFKQKGMAKVRVQYLGPAPLNDKGSHLAMMNEKLREGAGVRSLVAYAKGRSPQPVQVAQQTDYGESGLYQNVATQEVIPRRVDREGYVVTVAAFANSDNADAAGEELSQLGSVRVRELQGADGPVYVLKLGPFRSELAARQARDGAIESGFPEASISAVRIQAASAKP